MRRILAGELRDHAGATVRIAGWLHRQRRLSRVTFLIVRDRSGVAQVVVGDRARAERVGSMTPEAVLSVTGRAVAAAQAPGGVEVHEPDIKVIAEPAEPPPLELWRPALSAQLPTRLDLAPLALRHPQAQAVFRVSAASIAGFRGALDGLGFTEIQTPKIVASRPRAARTCSRSTTSVAPRTSRRARSSTSRRWSGCSSASTRPGRCSVPSHTTRPVI